MQLTIAQRCEKLADAFEAKGVKVRSNLRPGLSRDEITVKARQLGIRLPSDVIELYEWHDGHVDEEHSEATIHFRDRTFISADRALVEFQHIQQSYGLESTLEGDHIDLKAAFPIAYFSYSWCVVACGSHLHGADKPNPIISVFQGVDLFFYSLASMLDTCTAWISHPEWRLYYGLPEPVEMRIWQKHNPGIFPHWRE